MRHPGASSFVLGPASAPRVLLFHGLTGTPGELWPLGCALARAGYRVEAPMLPGHGTKPEALFDVDADDIIAFARAVAQQGPPPAVLGGLSFGTLLSLCVAAELPPQAMVLLAPAAVMAGSARTFDRLGLVPWRRAGGLLVPKAAPDLGDEVSLVEADPIARAAIEAPGSDGPAGRYTRIPLRWATQLRRARQRAKSAAARVQCPVLVAHGLQDRTASASSAGEVASWLQAAPVSVRLFAGSRHILPLGAERGRLAVEVAGFLSSHLPAAPVAAESA